MSFSSIKTLKDIENSIPQKSGGSGGAKKFFNLQSGDTYKVRFRQELTEDSKHYEEEVGTGIIVPVVTSPINWKWRCASTASMAEHGYRCWATEQVAQDGVGSRSLTFSLILRLRLMVHGNLVSLIPLSTSVTSVLC